MAFLIDCPNCGRRPRTEYTWGGEEPGIAEPGRDAQDAWYGRAWLRRNASGRQRECWFHAGGCCRWVAVERDTRTNEVHVLD
jgi:methylglutamate dehydrogenase subunit B